MTMLQLLNSNNGNLTKTDLAQLARWASDLARLSPPDDNKEHKRAYSLIREGADLLLRHRTLREARAAAWISENPSMADLTQNPKESIKPLREI